VFLGSLGTLCKVVVANPYDDEEGSGRDFARNNV